MSDFLAVMRVTFARDARQHVYAVRAGCGGLHYVAFRIKRLMRIASPCQNEQRAFDYMYFRCLFSNRGRIAESPLLYSSSQRLMRFAAPGECEHNLAALQAVLFQ